MIRSPRIHVIGSREASDLIHSLRSEPPVAFVGSGVSIWEPSGMPSGQDFTAALYSLLFDSSILLSAEERPIIQELFNEMPFEHVLEVCPNPRAAGDLLVELYGRNVPNAFHNALAAALGGGEVRSLVTTNYDCCLEASLNSLHLRVRKIVTEDDAETPAPSLPTYFKIHGSSEPGLEHTAIRTLGEEHLLPAWKRSILRDLLEKKTLVFIGYSGRDFELCPEIARIAPSKIVWISRNPAPPSVNAKLLLQNSEGHILSGDMNAVLHEWLGSAPTTFTIGMDVVTQRSLSKRFTHEQLKEWRLAILVRIGAPILALRTIETAVTLDRVIAKRQRGHALVSAGKCHSAARDFLQASWQLYRRYGRAAAGDALLDVCDAYRIYGAVLRSWIAFAGAAFLVDKQFRAKMLLKSALLLFAVHGFLPLAFARLRRWLRRCSVLVLRKCAMEALAKGNWLDFQQAGLVGLRLGIPLEDLAGGDSYPPPQPGEGYLQLGYFLAQSMALLDDIEKRPPNTRTPIDRSEVVLAVSRQLHYCDALGIAPQSWKLRAASRSCFDLDSGQEADYVNSMLTSFRACEYTRIMKSYWRRRMPLLKAS